MKENHPPQKARVPRELLLPKELCFLEGFIRQPSRKFRAPTFPSNDTQATLRYVCVPFATEFLKDSEGLRASLLGCGPVAELTLKAI